MDLPRHRHPHHHQPRTGPAPDPLATHGRHSRRRRRPLRALDGRRIRVRPRLPGRHLHVGAARRHPPRRDHVARHGRSRRAHHPPGTPRRGPPPPRGSGPRIGRWRRNAAALRLDRRQCARERSHAPARRPHQHGQRRIRSGLGPHGRPGGHRHRARLPPGRPHRAGHGRGRQEPQQPLPPRLEARGSRHRRSRPRPGRPLPPGHGRCG